MAHWREKGRVGLSDFTHELMKCTTPSRAQYLIDKATRNDLRIAKGQLRMELQQCWEEDITWIRGLIQKIDKRLRSM